MVCACTFLQFDARNRRLERVRGGHALLDRRYGAEPPADDAPIRKVPNLVLSPHIAGSSETGMARIGAHVIDELDAFFPSGTLKEEVTREMLGRIV